jgi:sporulation protein YlmC with PRC-barrel domain
MGIYLGQIGQIELTRKSSEGSKQSIVNPSDVNAGRNRFSFDFDEGTLITGDLLEISTTDGTDLDFVDASGWADSTVHPSGNWYVFIDELGGIKLYDTFANSLDGGVTGVITLSAIARDIPISVIVRDRDSRIVGEVTDYELNTNREVVDISVLGDEYRQQYSSLISGSGRLTAHWDYTNNKGQESVNYLMQLVLRTEIGSLFHGKFYIKAEDTTAQTGSFEASQINDSLWWEFDALVTAAAVSFTPDNIIVGTIDFAATGPIKLRASTRVDRYLLQEDTGKLELEQAADSYLLLEEPD